MVVRIRLIGRPAIIDGSALASVRGHKSWALLARVLLSDRPIGRSHLAAELFPEADDPLGSLRWCLAALRRALGSKDVLTGDPLIAGLPDGVSVDLWSLAAGDIDDVDIEGELLEGVDPRCGPEMESWLLVERERIGASVDAQIRAATLRALSLRDHERAITLGELLVRRRPYVEGSRVLLVRALASAGRTAAAEQQVVMTEELFAREMLAEPSSALRSAARRAVADPALGISTTAVARSLLESGLAAIGVGAVDAGLDCLRRACAEAERSDDRHLRCSSFFELGSALVHSVRGYDDEGSILLRYAVDLGRELGDDAITANALRELGYVDALAGRRPTAAEYLAEARLLAGDDAELLAGIHGVLGFNLVDWGLVADGLGHFEHSIELARSAGKPRREAWSLGIGAWGLLQGGDLRQAGSWLGRALEIVGDERWLAFRPWPLALLGEVALRDGQDPAAVALAQEETFALSRQLADPCWEGTSARVIALAHSADGRTSTALDWIAEAHTRCGRNTDVYVGMEAWILVADAEIATLGGDGARADAAARELLATAARTHMDGLVDRALVLLR